MIDVIPEGRSGDFVVEHYEVTEHQARMEALRWAFTGNGSYSQKAGKYAVLKYVPVNSSQWSQRILMSDTPMEMESMESMLRYAKGRVLVGGLGLGVVCLNLIAKQEVTEVLVVELERNVIQLVYPHLKKFDTQSKITVINGDILNFQPVKGLKFDTIWFDIWDNICADNLEDMNKLHRRFRSRLVQGGYMNSWMRIECLRAKMR